MIKIKELFAVAFMLAIGLAMVMNNVSAQIYPTPEIVVTPQLATGAGGAYISYKFDIKNAPHIDYDGDTAYWDKECTWGWQVEVTWDPTVLDCPSTAWISEDAAYSFLGWTNWEYWYQQPTPPFLWVKAPYPRSALAAAVYPGKAVIQNALTANPDVTTMPIYVGDPNAGLHTGTNYDLPYTAGISAGGVYPANTLNLFTIWFQVLSDMDGPPHSSIINIAVTYFWCHDATTIYTVSTPDAWFGVIGPHIHSAGSLIDLYAPVCTTWHGLYPADIYCNMYHLSEWDDNNGDDYLSPCDYIVLTPTEPAGTAMWYHVEDVTVTITVSLKPQQTEIMYIDYERDPRYPYDLPITEPVCTQWHELYPDYCKRYHLTTWEDTQAPGEPGYGELSESDQIVLVDKETGVAADYHVDDVSTDIIVKPEPDIPVPEFPLGIELIMALALMTPLIYLWRRKGWKK